MKTPQIQAAETRSRGGATRLHPVEWLEEGPFAVEIKQWVEPFNPIFSPARPRPTGGRDSSTFERNHDARLEIRIFNHRTAGRPVGVRRDGRESSVDS